MKVSRGRLIKISLLGWIAFLAIDFLVHGALLTRWYEQGSLSLLPLEEAFARIPLGYLSFFLLVVLIVWLCMRLELSGAREGLGFGLSLGSFLAASHGLALVSITTIDPVLLLWWSVSEAFEIGVVGCVVGRALGSERLGRLGLLVVVGAVILLVVTVSVQNL
jgi:hypothetical protein